MYLPTPPGQQMSSPSIITRRRLKAFFPVLVALLLIPFLVSAFHGGGDNESNLLAKARRLYHKDGDSSTTQQASLKSTVEENGEEKVTANPYGPEDVIKSSYGYGYGAAEDVDFTDLDLNEEPSDENIDHDLPNLEDLENDYAQSGPFEHEAIDTYRRPGKSLLDLMDFPEEEDETLTTIPDRGDYRELFSLTTRDRRFIPVFIEGAGTYGPNVVPHPTKFDMWIVLAQRLQSPERSTLHEQILCTAGLLEGVLICGEAFENLTMSSWVQDSCQGELAYYNDYVGSPDARMFYGPHAPFVLYASRSQYTCSSMWLQDARTLLEPYHLEKPLAKIFSHATEIQRPPPYKGLESDFFVFWDFDGKAYAHYEMWPKRIFAQLDIDGSVGDDLGPAAAKKDQVCVAKYMPIIKPDYESLQQTSNSLAITLCERADARCHPDDSNTFLMHIFHHTSSYDSHVVHEPFVILFQQSAPFALHAISQRALWIHGRQALTNETQSPQYPDPEDIPAGHTERFAITSMSWKNHVQRYHGYTDDILMLGVSVEDSRAGVMDVKASDLVQDLAFC